MATAVATEQRRGRASVWLEVAAPAAPDSAARRHLALSLPFLVAGAALSLLNALRLVAPELLGGAASLSFGRVQPMATTALLWGWLTLSGMAAIYFLVPRLTGVRLHHERLANANLWLAAGVYGAGMVLPGLGHTSGVPFAEFPGWLDPLALLAVIVPAVVVTATVRRRRERNLYVSMWYVLAAVYWMPLVYLVGKVPGLSGVGSAIQGWFFLHNLLGLWLGAIAVAAMYYVIPKVSGNPLYSHALAMIGFWSLAFVQVWGSAAPLVHGPVPDWLQTVAVVFAAALLVPVLVVLANLAGTMQGDWDLVRDSFAVRFAVLGGASYLALGVTMALQATRSAWALVGSTPWAGGTLMLASFGFLTSWMAAFVYHAWPRLIGRDWFSRSLAERHFRFTAAGVVLGTLGLWLAGLVSGYAWTGGASTGAFVNTGEGFARTLAGLGFLYLVAAAGMALVAVGQGLFALNVFRTFTSGPAVPQEVLVPAPATGSEEAAGG